MITLKFVASFLIVAGALGAAYGGFNYTKETHEANIGPLQLQVMEKGRINIPMWTGLGAVKACKILADETARRAAFKDKTPA